jgi:hypothetical protein
MNALGRVLIIAIAAGWVCEPPLTAQSKNPIQAAKDAYKKAREEQAKKSQPQPAAPPQTPQTSQPSNPANTSAARPQAASGDCCSPDALSKIASSFGFLDIVGIKLGMTPEQAFAAVKAHNGQLKIDIINARMEDPDGGYSGSFTRVPQFAVAHTVGLRPNPNFPALFVGADGSSDVIVIEFTIPPSPPLVGRIVREVNFPRTQLVVASNLLDALRKKYGQESLTGIGTSWVFDSAGKLLSRPLQGDERNCLPNGARFGWSGMPQAQDMASDYPTQLSVAHLESVGLGAGETSSACRPFGIVEAYPFGQSTAPNQQLGSMTVLVQSPALLYGSGKAAYDWLKARGDAKTKRQEDAAKARSAPKL